MHHDCFVCDLKQMNKIGKLLSLDKKEIDLLINKTNQYLNHCDMNKTNPEIMGEIYSTVCSIVDNEDPYYKIKEYYNELIINMLPKIEAYIANDLLTALKVAISANLIDFSAKDHVSINEIEQLLFNAKELSLAIDDSNDLFSKLKTSKQLLYLGDNCGEIVLDKLLIKMLKRKYPSLHIYYAVRAKPIVNDVTRQDAYQVKMDEVATIVDNGDGALGTVLENTSNEFKKLFNEADAVICKGQGNFEGLYDCRKDNVYFLFMVKCKLVAKMVNARINDIICLKQII